MYPERIRAVGQETWRIIKRPVGYAAAGVSSWALACTPQPTPEQTSRFQEPPKPKDDIVLQATNTPTPAQELPTTATPEPTPATATPRPPAATPTPFTIETPFLKDRVYDGRVYIEKAGGLRENKGYAAFIATLRQDLGAVFSYVIDATCPPGSPERQIRSGGSIKIDAQSFLNRGFAQKSRLGEQLEGVLIREGAVSGNITFPPHFDDYHKCGIGKVQWATSSKGEGTNDYLGLYVGLFKQAGLRGSLTTAEALAEIEKDIGGVKLPSPASR